MIIFNEEPKIRHEISDIVKEEILNNGYAVPVDDLEIQENNAAVLHFMNVEDHVDGNGISILWLINGEGSFFINEEEYHLKKGDVLVFDDNIPHSFASKEICTAVNFTLDVVEFNFDTIKNIVQNFNEYNQQLMHCQVVENNKKIRNK